MAKQLLSKRRSLVAHILRLRNGFWRELVEKNPGNGNRTRLEESSLGPANLVPHSAVQIFANLRRWGLDRRAEDPFECVLQATLLPFALLLSEVATLNLTLRSGE